MVRRLVLLLAPLLVLACLGPLASAPPAYAAEPSWWNGSFTARRSIAIETQDALVSGYSVKLTFNHAELVSQHASRADGNDVRVVRWNGSGWDAESHRVLAIGSAWNTSTTSIYFTISTAIGASQSNHQYYLYFGNPYAGTPPANPHSVYRLFDDFSGPSLDTSKWLASTNGISVTQSGGAARISGTTDGTSANLFHGIFVAAPQVASQPTIFESTLSVTQQANSAPYWAGAAGLTSSSLALNNRRWMYYVPDTWYDVGPSTLTLQNFTSRVATAFDSVGVVGYVNGVIEATRPMTVADFQPAFAWTPDIPSGPFSITFDDVVIRDWVRNAPTVSLDPPPAVDMFATVAPILTLEVSGRTPTDGACNGITPTISSTATVVDLGTVLTGASSGAQNLTVRTNSPIGYSLTIRTTGGLESVGHSFNAVTGSDAAPAAFGSGEAWGYSVSGVSRFSGGLWAAATTSPAEVSLPYAGPNSYSQCIVWQARGSSTTPAGSYRTDVIYRAVATF